MQVRATTPFIGANLFLIGLMKYVHLYYFTSHSLTLETCLGRSMELSLGAPPPAHCWGCYAMAVGLLILAAAYTERLMSRSGSKAQGAP